VTKDSDYCESHTCAITEGIANENLGWEPIVLQKGQSTEQERNHYGQGIHVVFDLSERLRGSLVLLDVKLNDIVNNDEAADDEALADFDTVDTSVNIDGVRAENCDVAHINVIKYS